MAALTRAFGLTTVLGLSSLASTAYAMTMTNGVEFLFPTQGATLHYNDYVQVQYISNFTDPWLFTFCEEADGSVSEKQKQGVGSLNNTATVKLDWSGSDTPCWFDLKPNSTATVGDGANSDEWSFDVSQRAATTVGLESPSSTAASSSGSRISTSTTPTSSPTSGSSSSAATNSATSSGLSVGAQAGIGVGAAIVGIALGAVAATLFIRRRRTRQRKETGAAIEAGRSKCDHGSVTGSPEAKTAMHTVAHGTPISEVEGYHPVPHELDSARSQPFEMPTTEHGR